MTREEICRAALADPNARKTSEMWDALADRLGEERMMGILTDAVERAVDATSDLQCEPGKLVQIEAGPLALLAVSVLAYSYLLAEFELAEIEGAHQAEPDRADSPTNTEPEPAAA